MTFECEDRFLADRGTEVSCTGIESDDVSALQSLGECGTFVVKYAHTTVMFHQCGLLNFEFFRGLKTIRTLRVRISPFDFSTINITFGPKQHHIQRYDMFNEHICLWSRVGLANPQSSSSSHAFAEIAFKFR